MYDLLLAGKRAVVTGASRGIGKAISLAFARHGASLIVNYPDMCEEEEATGVVEEIRSGGGTAYAVRADVTVVSDVDDLIRLAIEYMGGIDTLVNNAGVCPWHEFLNMSVETWQLAQSVNHLGTFLCSQRTAREMIAQ